MIVSIIVPAYNEEETIAEVLNRVMRIDIPEKEIIVVDDGSSDRTTEIAATFDNVLLISHGVNKGKAEAVKTGLKHARGDIIVIQDADLEYAPEEIVELITPIANKEANVVYGSRFLGSIEGMALSHFWGNKILTGVTNILYGARLTDMMTGHKAFKREVLERISLTSKRFEFEPEVTAKTLLSGFRIKEIPIKYKHRTKGKEKIGWRDGLKCLLCLLIVQII